MSLFMKRINKSIGLPPGTIVHIGEKLTETVEISACQYNSQNLQTYKITKLEECTPLLEKKDVTWINVNGLHDTEKIAELGLFFNLHPLILESLSNTESRPKIEIFDKHLFLLMKRVSFIEKQNNIEIRQLSLILGENYLITFFEKKSPVFEQIMKRLTTNKSRIRKMGTDYLTYTVIDAALDFYHMTLEQISDQLDKMEETVLENPDQTFAHNIHNYKTQLLFLRKSITPLRGIVNQLHHDANHFFSKEISPFLRDLHEHVLLVIENIEISREIISGMYDTYLSSMSNKMNAIMKVLSLVASLFIPLTFLAGLYGMNFQHMPELKWKWGYPGVLILMAISITIMIFYYKKKKWL